MEHPPLMYAACLFCNARLGRNDELEEFPVGTRLAYDQWKGRLWVICPACARWNLTPLESRWEAIEAAEVAYRSAQIRRTTENIGLARLRGGLELVRLGKPPRLELAAWRYGGHLRRRRSRYYATLGTGMALGALPLVGVLGTGALPLLASGAMIANITVDMRRGWKDRNVATVFIRDHQEQIIALSKSNTTAAEITAVTPGEWYLFLRHPLRDPVTHRLVKKERGHAREEKVACLSGEVAQRALGMLLPHANPDGSSTRGIRDALDVIGSSRNLDRLIFNAATAASAVTRMPQTHRLALEMLLHEDDERRAMEGELAALEERWREAEEIANIADSLL